LRMVAAAVESAIKTRRPTRPSISSRAASSPSDSNSVRAPGSIALAASSARTTTVCAADRADGQPFAIQLGQQFDRRGAAIEHQERLVAMLPSETNPSVLIPFVKPLWTKPMSTRPERSPRP